MKRKEQLFKTAKATIGCAHFKAGEFVAIEWECYSEGKDWYNVVKNESGDIPRVIYPAHHLTQFCL